MRLGLVVETDDAETVWNAFRLANEALDAGHEVRTFLLGDGVSAPDVETAAYNPHGVMVQYARDGGELEACATCLDSRGIDADDLRPRSSMAGLLAIVTWADETMTFG